MGALNPVAPVLAAFLAVGCGSPEENAAAESHNAVAVPLRYYDHAVRCAGFAHVMWERLRESSLRTDEGFATQTMGEWRQARGAAFASGTLARISGNQILQDLEHATGEARGALRDVPLGTRMTNPPPVIARAAESCRALAPSPPAPSSPGGGIPG